MKKIVIAALLLINSFSLQGTNSEIQLFKEWPITSTVGLIGGGVGTYYLIKNLIEKKREYSSLSTVKKSAHIGLSAFIALCTMKLLRASIIQLMLPTPSDPFDDLLYKFLKKELDPAPLLPSSPLDSTLSLPSFPKNLYTPLPIQIKLSDPVEESAKKIALAHPPLCLLSALQKAFKGLYTGSPFYIMMIEKLHPLSKVYLVPSETFEYTLWKEIIWFYFSPNFKYFSNPFC